MKINRSERFKKELFHILEYIAKDKLLASVKFKDDLDDMLENLTINPYKFRSSYYVNDDNVRDMIFHGYTVVYRVNEEKNLIEIVRIFNKNKPPEAIK